MTAAMPRRLRLAPASARFDAILREHGQGPLVRGGLTTLQVNVGKRCNQACHHCHVDAGPKRTETMSEAVAERVLEIVARAPGIEVVDITGGAPELNPHFERLVSASRAAGKHVIDRCNLTVFFEPGRDELPAFLAQNGVHVIASLPCYQAANVDGQRGAGVFEKSIRALLLLNQLGYGKAGSGLLLDLVFNPLGPVLPPHQAGLQARYKAELEASFGIEFNSLFTLANMPIQRFARSLEKRGEHAAYMSLLVNHFNAATVGALMCRSLLSVGWQGELYDCDFNQMLELPLGAGAHSIWDLDDPSVLEGRPIATEDHCFACTAGAGSSCGGALQ